MMNLDFQCSLISGNLLRCHAKGPCRPWPWLALVRLFKHDEVSSQIIWEHFVLQHLPCRYDDLYRLTLEFTDGKTGATRDTVVERSVGDFIDENGLICQVCDPNTFHRRYWVFDMFLLFRISWSPLCWSFTSPCLLERKTNRWIDQSTNVHCTSWLKKYANWWPIKLSLCVKPETVMCITINGPFWMCVFLFNSACGVFQKFI